MNFLQPLGFKLYGLGWSDIWTFSYRGEILYKASSTMSGKILITDSSDKVIISSRNSQEIIDYLTVELRDFKIDKLL